MKFATRLIIIATSILTLATQSFAAEIRSTVSPGVIQITQNADKTWSFVLCRDGEGKNCDQQLGDRPSYSTDEIVFRYNELRKQKDRAFFVDGGVLLAVTATTIVLVAVQAVPGVDAAVDTGIAAGVAADATTTTAAEVSAETAEEVAAAENAAVAQRTTTAISKIGSLMKKRTLLTAGIATFSGSAFSTVRSWIPSTNPITDLKLSKTVNPETLETDTTVTVTIPIEEYAQRLNTALNSQY